jgi:hypothetical protein
VWEMPHGGKILISAENRVVDLTSHKPAQAIKEGDHVKIAIKDEGHGIPDEIIPIFPQTTKEMNSIAIETRTPAPDPTIPG